MFLDLKKQQLFGSVRLGSWKPLDLMDLPFNLDMLGDVLSFVYPNTFIALARWNK